jgi:RNA polymerase sigma-70 factor (ECF subfamily)
VAERAFDEFYASNYGRLVVQLYAVTGVLADAEDAVQEAFARASVRWRRLQGYDAPEAWVRRVALNLASSAIRRARRAVELGARIQPPPPLARVDNLELVEALKALPLSLRQVVVLYYLTDLPVEQVAGELGIAVGTAKSRLSRAREALASALASDEEEVARDRR